MTAFGTMMTKMCMPMCMCMTRAALNTVSFFSF